MDYRTAPVYHPLISYIVVAVVFLYETFVPRYNCPSSAVSLPPPHRVLPCHRGLPVTNGMMWWGSSGIPSMPHESTEAEMFRWNPLPSF